MKQQADRGRKASGVAAGGAHVHPIGETQRAEATEATRSWVQRAAGVYGRAFPMLPVLFDLRGRMAGMYRVAGERRVIRYNPWLFAKYPEDGMQVTVPHEVAHYVTDLLYGFDRIRPHGREWQGVMRDFGIDPRAAVRHHLDLTGIPMRTQRRHPYRCDCKTHQLSGVRHGRVIRDKAKYFCRTCGGDLIHVGASLIR